MLCLHICELQPVRQRCRLNDLTVQFATKHSLLNQGDNGHSLTIIAFMCKSISSTADDLMIKLKKGLTCLNEYSKTYTNQKCMNKCSISNIF